ncbi:MAG: thiol-disulfide oxidoreductase DCC family protein [Bacteroidetes bacterium]|nr:thiol-disulfide oxidoreductase DCC family protein [Bacteroidota bacterium]MCB0842228.1 thiol-disulfide oxidoreductase DCC family protein [Bacteroidota bacterium]
MESIIIFDGVCNFCNASVDFIMKRDKQKRFKFTANQNEAGKEILSKENIDTEDVGTIYLLDEGKLYKESTAALRIARHLTFPWNLAYGFVVVPRFLRDPVYQLIARNRYKWFGKKDSCRLPSPEEAARFI